MTRIAKFTAIAAAVIAAPAFAAATIDANLELDNTFYSKNADRLQQGGRVEVNVGAKTTVGSGFVAAKGTLLIKKDGSTGADDMWVEGGNDAFSVKLGRFEATDLSPLGKDTLVVSGVGSGDGAFYRGNALRGRQGGSDFHAALSANLGAGVGFELGLAEVGTTGKDTTFGIRPVVSFGAAGATIKLGVEKVESVKAGFGATAALKAAGGDVNVSFAKQDKAKTFGLNGTFGAFGAGLLAGKNAADQSINSVYAAYTVPFFVPAASFTIAASTGKVKGGDRETGLRARVNYGF
jgi:hypothetical protein